ncbi:MAG: FtsQ-type POTRA domain-containing protein [Nostocales cyanobacterium]|nr:MAG: FtsQ-type POTRA domain-containing protein [Nostocales cyanobacterium]TAF17419.1 MAG: FtsQ-type POTRA domain-containing protein [Nostocales cyanobacterium]
MAGIISVSRKDLAKRRQKLRQQRRIKIIQTIWRTLAASGMAGGLLWLTVQPIWVLRTPTQVVMTSNNQILSSQTIESLLALSYPQSLWRIEPASIAETLKQQPAISQVNVSRRLFPPGLIIEVHERLPVAISQIAPTPNINKCQTQSPTSANSETQPKNSCLKNPKTQNKQNQVNLLDANGALIPWEKYTALNPNGKLPSLKVVGVPEQYRAYWNQLYQAVSQSSVQVTEIDCQNPSNIILKTELGPVHLGVPTQLAEKFHVLEQIQQAPSKPDSKQIGYIDIKNPNSLLLHIN